MIQILFIFCAMYGYRTPLIQKVDPRCYENDYARIWVYFTDKNVTVDNYNKVLQSVKKKTTKSSYQRRLSRGGIFDYADIPVHREYIDEVEANGGLLINKSKWLNAVSFWVARRDLENIARLDFVHKITRVVSFKEPGDLDFVVQDTSIFGLSYQQLKMFNIDKLHNIGILGSNVKIGILDTGLRRKHTALDSVNVIAEYDFLEGDQIFLEANPITIQYGVYSDIVFHRSSTRLNLFLTGDTLKNNLPVRDVLHIYSTDGGSNWSIKENLTNNFQYQWVNELNTCGNDTIFVFYRQGYGTNVPHNDLKYLVLVDTLILIPPSILISGNPYREPSSVQVDDSIYVVYHDKNNLYLRKGNLTGFAPGISIDSSTQQIKAPKAVSGVNKIGFFYHTVEDDSLYFLESSIPAITFSKKLVGIGKNVQAVADTTDTIFVIWQEKVNDPLLQIAFLKSNDFGDSFSQPIYLSDDLNSIGKISIAKHNATVTVMWETEGRIFFRTSLDNGTTFQALDSLSDEFVYLPTLGTSSTSIMKFYCTRGDTNTDGYSPNDPDYDQPHHGTQMLSLIGAYLRDHFIGAAPAAQFIVAKTEVRSTAYEFPVEEDTWIAGLEWCESKGADIINSSLGYTDWYDWPDDYDGKTSPASIAAQEAIKRGMIIVNASGNFVPGVHRIVVPGDAENIITVGGIDTLFNLWESSGYWETQEHTVKKPEIMNLGDGHIMVDPDSASSYLIGKGTSGATALITGICALLLEGHPDWDSDSIRTALFATASHASTPSDSMGYGWPDAYAAFHFSELDQDTTPGNIFLTPYPNPFIPSEEDYIYVPFKLDQSHTVEIRLYSIAGRLVKTDSRGLLLPGRYTAEQPEAPNAAFIWDGLDEDGNEVGSGVYYCLLVTHGGGNDITKIAVIR